MQLILMYLLFMIRENGQTLQAKQGLACLYRSFLMVKPIKMTYTIAVMNSAASHRAKAADRRLLSL